MLWVDSCKGGVEKIAYRAFLCVFRKFKLKILYVFALVL